MPCVYGITDPAEMCRGTECSTCTGWDELCAGCGGSIFPGESLCDQCLAQLQAQPAGPEEKC
jgi:hypothetical protein